MHLRVRDGHNRLRTGIPAFDMAVQGRRDAEEVRAAECTLQVASMARLLSATKDMRGCWYPHVPRGRASLAAVGGSGKLVALLPVCRLTTVATVIWRPSAGRIAGRLGFVAPGRPVAPFQRHRGPACANRSRRIREVGGFRGIGHRCCRLGRRPVPACARHKRGHGRQADGRRCRPGYSCKGANRLCYVCCCHFQCTWFAMPGFIR